MHVLKFVRKLKIISCRLLSFISFYKFVNQFLPVFKFGGHTFCGGGDISVFISRLTSKMFLRLSGTVALQLTSLSCLVVIGLEECEFYHLRIMRILSFENTIREQWVLRFS